MRSFLNTITPFWRLGRFHIPLPIAFLYLPCVWGLAFVWRIKALEYATLQGTPTQNLYLTFLMPQSYADILLWAFLFLLGAIVMRAAGCVFNDVCDQDVDKHVMRTQARPLAAGDINRTQARYFLIVLLSMGLGVWICLSPSAKLWSLGALALLFIYPYTKRFFVAPQLILGFAFNSGVIIAVVQTAPELILTKEPWLLYAAGIFWTLYYDTLYGLQDITDDEKIGIHSTARVFKKHMKRALSVFYALSLACVGLIGPKIGGDVWFYGSLICFFAWDIGYELKRWDLSDPAILRRAFRHAAYLGIGVAVLIVWPD